MRRSQEQLLLLKNIEQQFNFIEVDSLRDLSLKRLKTSVMIKVYVLKSKSFLNWPLLTLEALIPPLRPFEWALNHYWEQLIDHISRTWKKIVYWKSFF